MRQLALSCYVCYSCLDLVIFFSVGEVVLKYRVSIKSSRETFATKGHECAGHKIERVIVKREVTKLSLASETLNR